jgi:mRNA interferase RelE/StbE
MFAIKIKRKALRKLSKLNPKQKRNIETLIPILKNDPIPFKKADVCKLRGYDSTYRIRIGDLRLVYQVFWSEKSILIHYIGPREKAYK